MMYTRNHQVSEVTTVREEVTLFRTRYKNGQGPSAGRAPAASAPLWGNARTPRGGAGSPDTFFALPDVHRTGTAAVGGFPARYRPRMSRCSPPQVGDRSAHG